MCKLAVGARGRYEPLDFFQSDLRPRPQLGYLFLSHRDPNVDDAAKAHRAAAVARTDGGAASANALGTP